MNSYKTLNQQTFTAGEYSLVPIRFEDRLDIMQWRNEQMYHLRQCEPLTEETQNAYFKNVVSKLFDKDKPDQLLFSFLKDEECIGYGGLVHINWVDKNAEISFIMDTALEKKYFESLWINYLSLIEQIAFIDLQMHKIFTYAFDLRPRLYIALENGGYNMDAVLPEHCFFKNEFLSVVIHSKINGSFYLRKANLNDLQKTFEWVNDSVVRFYSFNKTTVSFKSHKQWFLNKIQNDNCFYFMALDKQSIIGAIRFDVNDGVALISYLVDPEFHGNGYGLKILKDGIQKLLRLRTDVKRISGTVLINNKASIHIFKKLGFKMEELEGNYHFTMRIK